MSAKKITPFFTIGLIAVIALYDFWAYFQGGQEATISWIIIERWSTQYPAITFLVGFVMGHLFWPLAKTEKNK